MSDKTLSDILEWERFAQLVERNWVAIRANKVVKTLLKILEKLKQFLSLKFKIIK